MSFIEYKEPNFRDDGYRPNVGIIIINQDNKVFWARRISGDGWQFPQGGIDDGETVLDAMYRELEEETGFLASDVELVARTENWLRYDLPDRFLNGARMPESSLKARFKGQKQVCFLLRLINEGIKPNFELNDSPEFDDWRWINYWNAADRVVDFKRDVYLQALTELAEKYPINLSHNL